MQGDWKVFEFKEVVESSEDFEMNYKLPLLVRKDSMISVQKIVAKAVHYHNRTFLDK